MLGNQVKLIGTIENICPAIKSNLLDNVMPGFICIYSKDQVKRMIHINIYLQYMSSNKVKHGQLSMHLLLSEV